MNPIPELNRRWFAACARWGIVPPLDEHGEPTGSMMVREAGPVLEPSEVTR